MINATKHFKNCIPPNQRKKDLNSTQPVSNHRTNYYIRYMDKGTIMWGSRLTKLLIKLIWLHSSKKLWGTRQLKANIVFPWLILKSLAILIFKWIILRTRSFRLNFSQLRREKKGRQSQLLHLTAEARVFQLEDLHPRKMIRRLLMSQKKNSFVSKFDVINLN